ncbi:MAG: tetratricopeptide repeat protein [Bacteroidales bacterium]
MKKNLIIIVCSLAVSFGSAFAQTKLVKSATRDLANQKLDKAVVSIEAATVNPETALKADTWIVRARVYTAVAAHPMFKSKFENPEEKALESFNKALSLDSTPKMQTLIGLELPRLGEVYYNIGVEGFSAGNFALATTGFEKAFELYQRSGEIDSGAIFNIALCAAKAGQFEKAAKNYKILVDGNYSQSNIYAGLADVYGKMKKPQEASAIMDIASARYPMDSTIYIAAATTNLLLGVNDKAEKILKTAVEKWPTSDLLFFAMGVAYENNNRPEDAEKSYLKALELNSTYFDAIFNLGAFYVNSGIKIKAAAENLPLSESEKYESEMKRANEILQKAVPYLEKVIENQPNNVSAMTTLKDIYVHLRQMDKAQELNAKIDTLTK